MWCGMVNSQTMLTLSVDIHRIIQTNVGQPLRYREKSHTATAKGPTKVVCIVYVLVMNSLWLYRICMRSVTKFLLSFCAGVRIPEGSVGLASSMLGTRYITQWVFGTRGASQGASSTFTIQWVQQVAPI